MVGMARRGETTRRSDAHAYESVKVYMPSGYILEDQKARLQA